MSDQSLTPEKCKVYAQQYNVGAIIWTFMGLVLAAVGKETSAICFCIAGVTYAIISLTFQLRSKP